MKLTLPLSNKINGWHIFLFSLFIFFVSFNIVGIIPVNDGTGWDGAAYYNIIKDIVQNGWHVNDPYRTTRLAAFPQLLFIDKLGVEKHEMLLLQVGFNSLLLSLANVALYQSSINLGLGKIKAIAASFSLLFSWPVIVMVPFYPILGDHMALALACFCLYAWVKNNLTILLLLTFYSVWVFPSLAIVPMILAAFVGKKNGFSEDKIINHSLIFALAITVLITTFLIYTINENGYWDQVPFHSLDNKNNKTSVLTGIKDLVYISFSLCVIMIYYFSSIFIKLINNKSFWYGINPYYCVSAVITAVSSFLLMRYLINFNQGFSGPPLLRFLILQGLSAPAKSITSHFLYFGPLVILVYSALNKKHFFDIPLPISCILLAYMLPLIFGSESRQWLPVFPMIIVAALYLQWGPFRILITGLFSILILLPMLTLKFSTQEALRLHDGLQDNNWQIYFAYQGPWMNTSVYKLAIAFLVIFIIVFYCAKYLDRRLDQTPEELEACDKSRSQRSDIT